MGLDGPVPDGRRAHPPRPLTGGPLIRRLLLAAAAACLLLPTSASTGHVRGCHTAKCDRRTVAACKASPACKARAIRAHWRRVVTPYFRRAFHEIGRCESGGWGPRPLWHKYDTGGIGILLSSWAAYGGHGTPGQATALEQMYRGVLIYRDNGWGAWTCAAMVGIT